jgi:hypothetical protein
MKPWHQARHIESVLRAKGCRGRQAVGDVLERLSLLTQRLIEVNCCLLFGMHLYRYCDGVMTAHGLTLEETHRRKNHESPMEPVFCSTHFGGSVALAVSLGLVAANPRAVTAAPNAGAGAVGAAAHDISNIATVFAIGRVSSGRGRAGACHGGTAVRGRHGGGAGCGGKAAGRHHGGSPSVAARPLRASADPERASRVPLSRDRISNASRQHLPSQIDVLHLRVA